MMKTNMKTLLAVAFAAASSATLRADAYTPLSRQSRASAPATRTGEIQRREFGGWFAAATAAVATSALLSPLPPAFAFDGSGSSAYSGRSPAAMADKRQSYQDRITADVRDFNALGAALARGETTDSNAWINFFNEYRRRSPDSVGRTYAALADLIGHKGEGRDLEGGDGYLLAATYTKQGKPPGNTPAVKSYNALSPAFGPIEAAGKKGDAAKARAAWEKAALLFPQYLEGVSMPGALDDPLYK